MLDQPRIGQAGAGLAQVETAANAPASDGEPDELTASAEDTAPSFSGSSFGGLGGGVDGSVAVNAASPEAAATLALGGELSSLYGNSDGGSPTESYSPSVYPFDDVVLIETSNSKDPEFSQGSGVIIGPHTILTASHVLWDNTYDAAANNVDIYPAYSATGIPNPPGTDDPLAATEIGHFFEVGQNDQETPAQSASDYAVIDVSATFTSWFGIQTNFGGGSVNITGYPATYDGLQTNETATVSKDPNFSVLDYPSGTVSPGNSGGPLWINLGTSSNPLPYVVGLVSTSADAVQLTNGDLSQIQAWEAADSSLWGGSAPTPTTPMTPTIAMAIADIVFKTSDGSVPVWGVNGTQAAFTGYAMEGSATAGVPGPGWNIVDTTGDFNDDGNSDILWQTTAGQVAVWEMNGSQIESAAYATAGVPPGGWTILGAADFFGQGDDDILWQTGNGSPAIWEMNGAQVENASYTMQGSSTVGAPGPDWHIIGSGDFTGDGDSDILWRTDGGALAIWEMNGAQVKAASYIMEGTQQVNAPGPDWHLITTGDFNGDGKSDLLWETNSGQIAIWEMNGFQVQAAAFVGTVPGGWTLEGAADVNGDGTSDLLFQNGNGQVAAWEMNGFQVAAAGYVTQNGAVVSTPLDWSIAQHNYNYI